MPFRSNPVIGRMPGTTPSVRWGTGLADLRGGLVVVARPTGVAEAIGDGATDNGGAPTPGVGM
jgi:hypothetical protein